MAANEGTSRRALIVEDDSAVGMYLVELLGDLGFFSVCVNSFVGSLRALDSAVPFDVAFVDLGLPDRSGLEVIAEFQRRVPQLPIIVESGYAGMVEADVRDSAGSIVWLAKPFQSTEVRMALARVGLS